MRAQRAFAIAAAVAISAFTAATAEAQSPRRVTSGRPLVIQKPQRSFLDPGPVVPVGSLQNYVNQTTYLNVPPYSTIGPSGFGAQALPQRFEVPGRPSPLFNF